MRWLSLAAVVLPELAGAPDPAWFEDVDPWENACVLDGKEVFSDNNPHLSPEGFTADCDEALCLDDWDTSCLEDYDAAIEWEANPVDLGAAEDREKRWKQQVKLVNDEGVRSSTAIDDIGATISTAVNDLTQLVEDQKAAQIVKQQQMIDEELARSQSEIDTLRDTITEWKTSTGALHTKEEEIAETANGHRTRLKAQLKSLRKMMHANYCPPLQNAQWTAHVSVHEDVPQWISEAIGCEGQEASNCINNNAGYATLREAWLRCGEEAECGRIMNYTMNGKLYLRRRADMAGLKLKGEMSTATMPVALMLDYECMALCPVACQRHTASDSNTTEGGVCGGCAGGDWKAAAQGTGVQTCLSPRRSEQGDMGTLVEASGACPDGYTDCRMCVDSAAPIAAD